VTRRTNEIGVRIALGATASRITWMVLADALWMVGAGLALGALMVV
jgi:ABC-type antimicrobial peptide transport system permease subunit